MKQYLRSRDELKDLLVKHMIAESVSTAEARRRIGIAHGTMKRFLDDVGDPTFKTLLKISKYLDKGSQISF